MKLEIKLEQNEIDSPIRFATAIIEKCMDVTSFNPNEIDMNYRYLKTVNEHIDIFLKNFDYKGIPLPEHPIISDDKAESENKPRKICYYCYYYDGDIHPECVKCRKAESEE